MPEPERYFFLRFQKVGSTALVHRIRADLGDDAVFPGSEAHGQALMSMWVDPVVDRFRRDPDALRVVAGHYPLCLTEVLGVPFRTFTVLRDPVARALSLLRTRSQRGADSYRGRALEDLYEDPKLHVVIHNHMVKMLTLRPDEMTSTPLTAPVDFTADRFADAVEKLGGLDIVGLQARMEDLCAVLEDRFGWNLGPSAVVNSTENQPASEALRRRIEDDNVMDIELYRRGLELVTPARARARRATAPAGKIVITGTGRAGTTLLVQILDALGLDTGLGDGKLSRYRTSAHAGLESTVDDPDAPTVVKDMTLGFRMRDILEKGDVRIDHVIIPDRDVTIAAASRIRVSRYGSHPFGRGSLTGTLKATEQVEVLERMRREIVGALDDFGVPYTLLEFPRFATDAAYTHDTLAAVLPGVSRDAVQRALDQCVRPELIHQQPLTASERWRTRLTTLWMVLYKYPVARVKRLINPEAQEARLRAAGAAARQRDAELAGESGPLPPQSADRGRNRVT